MSQRVNAIFFVTNVAFQLPLFLKQTMDREAISQVGFYNNSF